MKCREHRASALPPLNSVASVCATLANLLALGMPAVAHASEVVANGQTNTSVTTSSKGATIVQIAAPNANGTSYNGFTAFSATNARGTYFNNRTENNNSASLGMVSGNSKLGGTSAKQIIGEVTGRQATVLSGPMGVLGAGADVVLVNPNGIQVNGNVTFSNMPQVTLAVGGVNRSGDSILSLDTSKAVAGASLSVNAALSNPEGALALLSPVVKVAPNASVTAANGATLTVATGSATFDPRSARLLAADPSAPSTVSVDASLLGAMKAGVINVVSTRRGAGVNIGGTWTAQNAINVDAQGGAVDLKGHDLTARGVDGIALHASTTLSVNGGKLTGGAVQVVGDQLVNIDQSVINASGDATLRSGGDMRIVAGSVSATQDIRVVAAGDVDMQAVSSTSKVVQPTISNETSTVRVSGSLGFGLFKPLGINISGSANLGGNYSAGESSRTVQAVTNLKAGQDVVVQAGDQTTLHGTSVVAGRDAAVQGAKGVNLLAVQERASSNSVALSLNGGGTLSGVVPYVFGSGLVTLNGSVKGSAKGEQSSSTTAKAVAITAQRDVTVSSSGGDLLTEGVKISAGENALIKAAGKVTMGVATSTNTVLSESAAVQGSVNVPVRVDSGLKIVGTLFTGGSLLNNVKLTAVNVAGSGTGGVTGNTTVTQDGGSITAGKSAKVESDKTVTLVGTSVKAPEVSIQAREGVKLAAAMDSSVKLNVVGGGVLAQQNFLAAKQLKLDIRGNLDGSVSVQGRGPSIQASNVIVKSAEGSVELNGATLAASNVLIDGSKGVDIGTALDLTGSVNAAFSGPLDIGISGLNLDLSKPKLTLSGGAIGVKLPEVDLSLNALVNLAVAGTAKGQMSVGGKGSQVNATQGIQISSGQGNVVLTGSRLQSGAGTSIEAANGRIDMDSALRLSGQFDSQFNVGVKSLLDLSVSIHDLSVALKPTSLRLAGIGLAVGADLRIGVGGLSLAGTSIPELSANVNLSGQGRATLGSDASSIKTGGNLAMNAGQAVSLSKPDIQSKGRVDIQGKSVLIHAPLATMVTGQLSAALPITLLPKLDIDFSQLKLQLGSSLSLVQSGGAISADQGISLQARGGDVNLIAAKLSTPGTVSIQASDDVRLQAGSSLANGKLSYQPTQITAGKAVSYQASSLKGSWLAPAVVKAPLITLNGQPQ